MGNSSKILRNKKYHTFGTVPKSNRKIVERGNIDNPSTEVNDHSLFWLGTVDVKLVLLAQTFPLNEMMQSC